MDTLIVTAANWRQYESELGGKARNLCLLQENGFTVPKFFAIRNTMAAPATGQEEVITQLASQISSDSDQTLYAVRSSGADEDSPERSYAGLLETFLCVRKNELLPFIEKCRASGQAERIRLYGGTSNPMPVCVIVQHMIKSEAAGVLFTANPAGSLTETVIVAAYGLGEGVVQDRVETDTYFLDRLTGTLRLETIRKTKKIDYDDTSGKGVCYKAVPQELSDCPVLAESEARSLAAIGMEIGHLYPNHFVDIEWCLDENRRVHILQCRPITSIPSGEFTVIDNSNIVEGYPGLTKALTFSILKDGYRKNFTALLRSIGIPEIRIDAARRALEHMVAYIEGRVYYNLSSWYRIFNIVPGCSYWLVPLFDLMIGVVKGGRTVNACAAEQVSLRHSRTYMQVSSILLLKFLTFKHRMRSYKCAFDKIAIQFRSKCVNELSNHDLIDLWLQLDTRIFRLIHIALLNDLFLMILVAAANKMLASAEFQNSESLFNALMCGEDGMESVLPVRSIISLAEKVRSQPALKQALHMAASSQQRDDLDRALSSDVQFAKEFYAHVECYGDRLPEELKIETVSFRENPQLLADAILQQADGALTVDLLRMRERAVREEAETTLRKGLAKRPLRQLMIRYLLRRTRMALANRESARLDRSRVFGFYRSLSRVLGNNLAREGAIAEPLDVCHLTFDELKDYILGSATETDLKAVVARRRENYRVFQGRNPDERMVLRGTVYRNFIVQSVPVRQTKGTGGDSDELWLHGIPCSPGTVSAEAIVVENHATTPSVAGKIIVARMTDPGWIFLIVSAAGLIIEKGSLLSHTAIIGRELGIPTIVGVTGATRCIRSGMRIKMDGSTGQIVTDG
jgi:pyruvate,water dikinase